MPDQNQQSVFLNGKHQIIEMLKVMNHAEREKLLNNIKLRNPQLAEELAERSVTFDVIRYLHATDMTLLFEQVLPPVMGLALRGVDEDLQRKVLSAAPKEYAQEAFHLMVTPLGPNTAEKIEKAQKKVLGFIAHIARKKRGHYS